MPNNYGNTFNNFLLQRGKTFPQLNYLIKVNTPRAVMAETKKAFKKLPNLGLAITALSNLKGVGTTMASGIPQLINVYFNNFYCPKHQQWNILLVFTCSCLSAPNNDITTA